MSLEIAQAVASTNLVMGLPRMGAVITSKRGLILGIGMNSRKSDPLAAKYGRHPEAIYLHAELGAIKQAIKIHRLMDVDDFSDCTLYVARVLKDGTPALAKPCSGCQRAILEFGIGDVVWTTNSENC